MPILERVRRRLRRMYFSSLGYYPTSICGTPFKVAPNRFEFWHDVAMGRWEHQTYSFLSRWLTPETVYFDVGAWIGPTVLYGATRCRQVVCFEPDPVAFCELRKNIDLNGLRNVRAYGVALSDHLAVERMSSFGTELGDSQSSLLNPRESSASADVVTVPWALFTDSANVDLPDVIKIDIEGGEFRLVPSIREYLERHRPVLCLSTHAPFLGEERRLDAMHSLRAALQHYDLVLDDALAETTVDALLDSRTLNEFRSFVFLDNRTRLPGTGA